MIKKKCVLIFSLITTVLTLLITTVGVIPAKATPLPQTNAIIGPEVFVTEVIDYTRTKQVWMYVEYKNAWDFVDCTKPEAFYRDIVYPYELIDKVIDHSAPWTVYGDAIYRYEYEYYIYNH